MDYSVGALSSFEGELERIATDQGDIRAVKPRSAKLKPMRHFQPEGRDEGSMKDMVSGLHGWLAYLPDKHSVID